MKKYIAAILAAAVTLTLLSCDKSTGETTAVSETLSGMETTSESFLETATESAETTAEEQTAAAETTETELPPEPVITSLSHDLEEVKIGKYITLRYNGNTANIEADVKKGVGSKETVTLTATMCNGFLYDGWSIDKAYVNGAKLISVDDSYTLTVNKPTMVFFNSSVSVDYYSDGKYVENQESSAVFYLHPSSLPDEGQFTKDGCILTGYRMGKNGDGEMFPVGARIPCYNKGKIELSLVWEKESNSADFTFQKEENRVKVVSYHGHDKNVVIPSVYENLPVTAVGQTAFRGNDDVERIVLGKNIDTVEAHAFINCKNLDTLQVTESIRKMTNSSMVNCPSFHHFYVTAMTTQVNEFYSDHGGKIDRLMWTKTGTDKNKIMIVGGSGCLFGYRSDMIKEAFDDKYEIINFGENAFISASFYFDLIEDFAKPGDIILWSPETGQYTNGKTELESYFWRFRNDDYGYARYIDFGKFKNVLGGFSWYMGEKDEYEKRPNDVLSPHMTKYGDDVRPKKCLNRKYQYQFHYQVDEAVQTEMLQKLQDKGVKVFYSYATMQKTGMQHIKPEEVENYCAKITSFPGVISISDWRECVYDDSYFWNSPWHLTNEGAILRTEQVIRDMKKELEK